MKNGKDNKADLFKGLRVTESRGITYYYAWRGKGAPKLSGDPRVCPVAAAEYFNAINGAQAPVKSETFAAVIDDYYKSPDFTKLSDLWRKDMRKIGDKLKSKFGAADLEAFSDKRMRQKVIMFRDSLADKPREADKVIAHLVTILNWAVDRGKLANHSCARIKRLWKCDRSEIIWEPEEIDAICDASPPHMAALIRLAVYTGLDMGDLLKLTWNHVGSDDIQTTRGKTGQKAYIPILPECREVLNALPRTQAVIITNSWGLPWGRQGVLTMFPKVREKAGIKGKRFKDLRGTAATYFLSHGLTYAEVGMIMGWSEKNVEDIARKYIHRGKFAQAIARKIRENANATT